MGNWVDAAQIVSGLAALVALRLSIVTTRAARRVPMTDSYLASWKAILDVIAVASEGRDAPPDEQTADALMRQFSAADHQLSVIEAMLRVRLYGRDVRSQLNNLLIDVLYEIPDIRRPESTLGLDAAPRPGWAHCSDEEWLRVNNSIPFTMMYASELWDLPGESGGEGLMKWYLPTVLHGLAARPDTVTSPTAPAQRQLAFLLDGYLNAFVLPWIRDASREALMGSLSLRDRLRLLQVHRDTSRHRRLSRRLRRMPDHHLGLFDPTRTPPKSGPTRVR